MNNRKHEPEFPNVAICTGDTETQAVHIDRTRAYVPKFNDILRGQAQHMLPTMQSPYDFSKPQTPDFRFRGIVPLADAQDHTQIIQIALGLDGQSLEDLKKLTITALWDVPLYTHIVPYDARTRLLEYCGELARELSYPSQLSELFSPNIDNIRFTRSVR